MKKTFTLLALLPLASAVYGQSITIASTDIPVPTTSFNCLDITSTAAPNPTMTTGGSWDYSAYVTDTPFTNVYATETASFFTAAGINVNTPGFKTLVRRFGYYVTSELAFTSTDVKEAGTNILAQGYGLNPFTGGTTDTLIIPAQQSVLTVPKEIMHFPFTVGSAWSSVSRRVTNFTLTVSSAFLTNTPGQHVYYVHRNDTISGSGTVRVYTPAGPSAMYSVLVDKIAQYATDSFYLGGAPAPTLLLTTFGVAQGQKTDSGYRYNFYRKGSYNYLVSFYYGNDPTYTSPQGKFVDTDGVIPANAGVEELNNALYTTVLFPNPSNGSTINMLINGKDVHAKNYIITDIAGRTVQSGDVAMHQGAIRIDLDSKLVNGNYIVTVIDMDNNKVATEQFVLAR